MDYLRFDIEEIGDGISTLEAMACTPAAQHAAVVAEAQHLLDWAWRQFPQSHGPIDDGMEWQHDLQITVEPGDWHTVTLTLTGTDRFVREFLGAFPGAAD
jgi:hypothetical protein